ncbi:MAG: Phytanoyl-CoA dioxygenase [Ferruginibacter sp.]|nr:Phytanoyl-CoA dioxygenase [Ferruginibacter sp.]
MKWLAGNMDTVGYRYGLTLDHVAIIHLAIFTFAVLEFGSSLDDATRQNGCLYYVPGSHRWGLLDKPDLAGDMEGLMQYLTDEQKNEFKPVPIEVKKGYATFHHPLMVHGSYENKSAQQRRAFVLNVFADGTLSNSDDVLLQGVPPINKNNKMEGQFFPLIFDPAKT